MKRALLFSLLAGCGAPTPTEEPPQPFIAFASNFATFRTWPSFHVDAPADGNAEHPLGPFTVYYRASPDHGATSWPVGTLVVKVIDQKGEPLVLAMAKRGGDYNSGGASGWEFFQLSESANGVTLVWRGLGPPSGSAYGGDPLTCNTCHVMAKANDYVVSGVLQLASY